jgi:hypothetical protein
VNATKGNKMNTPKADQAMITWLRGMIASLDEMENEDAN